MSYYRVGQQIGKYRLTQLIGEGGFAEVYLGQHVYLNTFAAIKLLNAHLTNQYIEKFLQEARTLARLIHPHIIRILDFGVANDTYIPFLVMDYAPNGTLRQRCPKGTCVSLNLVVNYVEQVAEALQYAHDQQLIHGDVKPQNMLLDQSGNVLLSDFGLATMVFNDDSGDLSRQAAAGTAVYMAPEQYEGRPRRASDQYALGIVVYEWLTGYAPFYGKSPMELWYQHLHAQPPLPRERVPAIPVAVEQVIMKALSKNPDDRYGTILDFAHTLEQAAQGIDGGSYTIDISSIPTIQMPSPSKQKQFGEETVVPPATVPASRAGQVPLPPPLEYSPTARTVQDICPVCGLQVQSQDAFCLNCGHTLYVDPVFKTFEAPLLTTPPNKQQGTIGTRFVPQSDAEQEPTGLGWDRTVSASPVSQIPSTAAPPEHPGKGHLPAPQGFKAEPTMIAPVEPDESLPPHYGRVDEVGFAQLMEEGMQHYKVKRFEEALEAFKFVVALDPHNAVAHGYKGNALGKLKRYEEALAAYEAALNIDAQHASIWSAEGDVLVQLKRLEEALLAYEKALSLSSQDALTWLAKAKVLNELKRYEKAVDAYKEYLSIKSQDASIWIMRGDILAKKLSRKEEALADYDAALGLNPGNGVVWEAKGKLLCDLQRYEESFAAFTKAAQLLPKRARVWVARSDVLVKLNRLDEALADCDRAYILSPKDRIIEQKCAMLRIWKQQKEQLAQAQSQAKQKSSDATPPPALPKTRVFSPGTVRIDLPEDQGASRSSLKETKNPEDKENSKHFDVYLSCAPEDKNLVEELAKRLEDEQGFQVWFGEWEKRPGESYQQAIAKGLQQSACCAVCIGEHAPKAWLRREMEWAIAQQTKKEQKGASFRVIPVLLSNAPQGIESEIDDFLKQNTLVDFRGEWDYAFYTLVCGVKGVPIGRWPPNKFTFTQTSSIAEIKLQELKSFKIAGLVDENVSIEYQRIVLNRHWLGIDDTEGKRQ